MVTGESSWEEATLADILPHSFRPQLHMQG
jgi:hypothetical protein